MYFTIGKPLVIIRSLFQKPNFMFINGRIILIQTSVIGFPRIGTLRELKFASEKYFRKEIPAEELRSVAKALQSKHWNTQKKAGVDYISSNDFSYYDLTLDTAVLLGIVPERYQELNLPELDTYFAMARGYQGESGDVKALAMKK
jgi:5-methyltetrahydropteroyltriglutamate--homocysteine methyltransferase